MREDTEAGARPRAPPHRPPRRAGQRCASLCMSWTRPLHQSWLYDATDGKLNYCNGKGTSSLLPVFKKLILFLTHILLVLIGYFTCWREKHFMAIFHFTSNKFSWYACLELARTVPWVENAREGHVLLCEFWCRGTLLLSTAALVSHKLRVPSVDVWFPINPLQHFHAQALYYSKATALNCLCACNMISNLMALLYWKELGHEWRDCQTRLAMHGEGHEPTLLAVVTPAN